MQKVVAFLGFDPDIPLQNWHCRPLNAAQFSRRTVWRRCKWHVMKIWRHVERWAFRFLRIHFSFIDILTRFW